MAQTKKKKMTKRTPAKKPVSGRSQQLKQRELIRWGFVIVLILLTLGIYLKDSMGIFGVGVNKLFVGLFGTGAYVITIYTLVIVFLDLFDKISGGIGGKLLLGYGFLLLLIALIHEARSRYLITVRMMYQEASVRTGGLVGGLIGSGLSKLLGSTGAIILIVFLMILMIAIITGRSLVSDMRNAGVKTKEGTQKAIRFADEKMAQVKLRKEERAAYRSETVLLKKEKGSDQIALAEEVEETKKEVYAPKAESVSVQTEEKKENKNSFVATFTTGQSPKGRRVTSIDLPRTNYDDEMVRQGEKAPDPVYDIREELPVQNAKTAEPEQAIIQEQVRNSSRRNEIIDIPLIANDAYLEKKRRYLERTNQLARQITENEMTSESIIPDVTPSAAAEVKGEENRRELKEAENVTTKPDLPTEEEVYAGLSFDEDGWDQLIQEAEESEKAADQKDDRSVSTEKMFENEEFPAGFEERSETAAKLQNEAAKVSSVGPTGKYEFPPIDLLSTSKQEAVGATREELLKDARKLEEVLMNFGVETHVVQVNRGPAVTRFELQPKVGVKVNKIVSLTDDIALNLAAQSIRIEAPIPGKSAVGIEIPNKEISMVTLREVLESEAFEKASSKVTFALGKDIDGVARVADVAKMPHMLIAGATGSGKSVCINSLIVSLLYKADPNDVKLILIDPKVVELSVYNGIPHLLLPVVNDPKQASATLNWAVQEMTRRYKKFAELNVRDIRGYNELADETQQEPLERVLPRMPQIVIVIDELADLMMVASKEVEASICRLAQMARAAGMHLVIATQRPSVDVITGLIKANIPSRIAFAVSSGIDSRTILDSIGAEKLLGKGDMLFAPIGSNKPVRIQGTFVSDREVENVVEFVRKTGTVQYDASVLDLTKPQSEEQAEGISEEIDEYLEEAIRFVVEKQKASISMLQRQFRIGFNRAARLMDVLEEKGVVGEDEGSKPRKVLLSREEL